LPPPAPPAAQAGAGSAIPSPAPSRPPAPPPAPAGFASLIVADFPALFAEFREKRFSLLWRGSRDGFGAADFHRRCDGRAPTLTLIQDTAGNIFGGFTPVAWESREWNHMFGNEDNGFKADPSLKSFLFTLKNPHNLAARKFALKAEEKDKAIYCNSEWGPIFGDDTLTLATLTLRFHGFAEFQSEGNRSLRDRRLNSPCRPARLPEIVIFVFSLEFRKK
jgi:hypothetical protein